MSLYDREIGALLSRVEWSLTFDDKYSDTGFVKYLTKDGKYFELRPSPFLENKKSSIYCAGELTPPPQHDFVQNNVIKEDGISKSNTYPIKSIKTIDNWKLFDPTPLAEMRASIDREEITDFFSKKYLGDKDLVNAIIECSLLYSFSSPPSSLNSGGVNTAVFGRKYQWNFFKFPLRIIPHEMKRESSDYYYYISEKERKINPVKSKERSFALFKPEKKFSDIPIVLDGTSERNFSKDYRENLNESSKIITAYLLDSLLLKPKSSKNVQDLMFKSVYELNEDYKHSGHTAYNQNLGDAIPKLAAAHARFNHNSKIDEKYVKNVMELWADMHYRTVKYCRTPSKIAKLYELSGDARKLYIDLNETYGVDYNIPIKEAFETAPIIYEDFILSVDSLNEKGFCIKGRDTIRLIEQ